MDLNSYRILGLKGIGNKIYHTEMQNISKIIMFAIYFVVFLNLLTAGMEGAPGETKGILAGNKIVKEHQKFLPIARNYSKSLFHYHTRPLKGQ